MTHRTRYAEVSTFRLSQGSVMRGALSGIAMPAKGSKPCAVALVAGSNLISIAEAIEFSDEAIALQRRLGWCGFSVGGIGQAIACAEVVELRCLVSDRPLAWWDSASLALSLPPQQSSPMRVEQMLGHIRRLGCSSDIEQVLPFGLHTARKEGTSSFLRSTWRYFLEREINAEEVDEWGAADYANPSSAREVWHAVVQSPECTMGKYYMRPGPFSTNFPFLLSAFDDNQMHVS